MKNRYVVLLNPGMSNECEDSRHRTLASARARQRSIQNCGDTADVGKLDDYGRITFDF